MTTCKYPSCNNDVGQDPDTENYRHRSFCCVKHDVKHEHLKVDARDARRAEQEGHESNTITGQ